MKKPVDCPECGAQACQEKYQGMLAFEFEHPMVFRKVHHITVLCFNLQHPDEFTADALALMSSALKKIIVDGISGSQLRDLVRESTRAGLKIDRHGATVGTRRRIKWSRTVEDVRMDSPGNYTKDVIAWAESILADLGKG